MTDSGGVAPLPPFPTRELRAWSGRGDVRKVAVALAVGSIVGVVTVAWLSGLAFVMLLVLGWRLGRWAVLPFVVVLIVASSQRSHTDPDETEYRQGAARVTVASMAPELVGRPPMVLLDSSRHHARFGHRLFFQRERTKDPDQVDLAFDEGTDEAPLEIGLNLPDGRWARGTDGDGCDVVLADPDPSRSFSGIVRCERMTLEGPGSDEVVDVELEVVFTAIP